MADRYSSVEMRPASEIEIGISDRGKAIEVAGRTLGFTRDCILAGALVLGSTCFFGNSGKVSSLVPGLWISESLAEESARTSQKNYQEYIMESEEVLKKRLSKEQYYVVRENGTERPFANEYWNTKEPGIYVDIVSGEPLFSSTTKFDSGTGWPSFYEPLEAENIVEVTDTSHGMRRVEVRSKRGDSHLGHIFNDGPKPTGLRYCINSAALRFVPADKLEEEGYGKFLGLFK